MMTLAGLLLALSAEVAVAQPTTFTVRNDGGSRIQFVSDAPLETITGVTSGVTGEVRFDPTNLSTSTGRVQVRVATLRTGVDLRDEHLGGANWLDAQRFPTAVFELARTEAASALRPNEPAEVTVHGRFSLHGVTRDVIARGRVRLVPLTPEMAQAPGINGDVLRVQVSFTVRLTDYGVSIMAPVRLKVSNEIEVNVNLRAVAQVSARQ